MLWGMLAVVVPVAIHFWYQKMGKTIEWAAMRWLGEQTTLQHRGPRLNEVGLMALRCLLVMLLTLIVSKPISDWRSGSRQPEIIHVVQPTRLVTEVYRFELEQAISRGEKVYWTGTSPVKAGDLRALPVMGEGLSFLQENINALSGGKKQFNLYFQNNASLESLGKIYIPGGYRLFPAADSALKRKIPYMELASGGRLFVDPQTGRLLKMSAKDRGGFETEPVHAGPLQVLLDFDNEDERKALAAALHALHVVYEWQLDTDETGVAGKHYDWIFTNKPYHEAEAGTAIVVTGEFAKWNAPANMIQLSDSLRLPGSELVESGQLPEWIGSWIINELKLKTNDASLSAGQLNALFESTEDTALAGSLETRKWLILTFILITIAERWLALRKNVERNHG